MSGRFAQRVYHFGSLSVAAQKVFVFQKINFTGETMNVIHAAEQIRAGQLHLSIANGAWDSCVISPQTVRQPIYVIYVIINLYWNNISDPSTAGAWISGDILYQT